MRAALPRQLGIAYRGESCRVLCALGILGRACLEIADSSESRILPWPLLCLVVISICVIPLVLTWRHGDPAVRPAAAATSAQFMPSVVAVCIVLLQGAPRGKQFCLSASGGCHRGPGSVERATDDDSHCQETALWKSHRAKRPMGAAGVIEATSRESVTFVIVDSYVPHMVRPSTGGSSRASMPGSHGYRKHGMVTMDTEHGTVFKVVCCVQRCITASSVCWRSVCL